jgi:hypothetical protein
MTVRLAYSRPRPDLAPVRDALATVQANVGAVVSDNIDAIGSAEQITFRARRKRQVERLRAMKEALRPIVHGIYDDLPPAA